MKFMSFEWRAFSQDDLESAMSEQGIEYDTFSYQFKGIHEDPYLYRNFKQILLNGSYDAVISWNFWPVVAEICRDASIPYIAWIYDCPISYEVMPWASYPTSHLFIFDRAECEKYIARGVTNVYHLPLAVNTDRIDRINLSEGDEEEYLADVSFLGTMYESEFEKYMDGFTEWERGYIESVINAQGAFFGDLIFDGVLEDRFLDPIMNRWNELGILRSNNKEYFRQFFRELLGKERTRRDRVELLNKLGEQHKTRYYSYRHYGEITKAEFHAPLKYQEDMFKMFRATRINLNITYRLITRGISLRALDIMAAGGFLLSNLQEEMLEHFEPGVDFACFSNEKEAIELVDYYLTHDEERRQIAENGHRAVRRFDYRNQLKVILEEVFS